MLFDEFVRNDDKPKSSRESDFEFLNRSVRPEIERVRQFLEELVASYPGSESKELLARLRSGNNVEFKSATFELCLYSFLLRLGHTLEPHPQLTNGSLSRPDFLVTCPDGAEFYLEAVLAAPNDGANPSADARIGTTLDALYRASHKNFYVEISGEGVPTSQPSGKRLLAEAIKWLDALDPDEVMYVIDTQGFDARPYMEWAHEQWKVTLRPIPIKAERRGMASTLIGIRDGGAGIIDEWTPIRDAIKFKGGKYGELEKPLLVAVNFASFHLDRIDEMQALYGQEQFVFRRDDPSMEPQFERAPNGAWHGPHGRQGTRVSGAWLFNDLRAHNIASRKHTVYINPWPQYALPACLNQMPHAALRGDEMSWHEGISLREVFGLSEGWPEQ